MFIDENSVYISTKDASLRWGYQVSTISRWCREGKIIGAIQDKAGRQWHIPVSANCPQKVKK